MDFTTARLTLSQNSFLPNAAGGFIVFSMQPDSARRPEATQAPQVMVGWYFLHYR